MDIRARHVLSILRSFPWSKNAILAGGAVRDEYFGIEPKDYDFFIPHNFNPVTELANVLKVPAVSHKIDYKYSKGLPIKKVYNYAFDGIDVQVMVTRFDDTEDFPNQIMNSFDYGINMIYYEGASILRDTEKFHKDFEEKTLTLYHLTDLKYLPKYMDRYTKINTKLGGKFKFKCPNLQLVKGEEKDELAHIPRYTIAAEWEPAAIEARERLGWPPEQVVLEPARRPDIPVPLAAPEDLVAFEERWNGLQNNLRGDFVINNVNNAPPINRNFARNNI